MIFRSVLVVAASIVLVILISYYNSKQGTLAAEKFEVPTPGPYPFGSSYPDNTQRRYDAYTPLAQQAAMQTQNGAVQPMDAPVGGVGGAYDNQYRPVEFPKDGTEAPGGSATCFPKDRLTSADLLPSGANTKWSQSSPNVGGSIGDGNLLNSGFMAGISTISGSMRNANLSIRSDPPITKFDVGPWQNSTITPDLQRKHFEIGSS